MVIQTAVVQFHPVFGSMDENLRRVENLLQSVEADLVVIPELFCSGYLFNSMEEVEALAQPIPNSPVIEKIHQWSSDLDATIVAGIPEKAPDGLYNSAVIIDAREQVVDVYRKIHLFGEEKRWFKPGNLGFRTWRIRGYTLGVMICFDWIFPEACRTLALKGAQVVAHPANLVLPYCQRALPIRSLENRLYIACANRTGEDRRSDDRTLHFTGQSIITGPDASVIGMLNESQESVLCADLDLTKARQFWVTPYNHLVKDRRPEWYRWNSDELNG